jgi:adenosylhomocysteine nucleosidase
MSETTIVILTAMNHEYNAVRKRLSDVTTHTHSMGTIFEIGHFSGNCRIALARTGVGNQPAAVTTERAVNEFAPAAIIFVGVAYALQSRLRLGDVVVATHVYAYHGATSEDSGLKARPRTWELSYRTRQIAEQLELNSKWRHALPAPPRTGPDAPRVVFGPIAAGEIAEYSATSDVRKWLHEHYNDAVAGEMEAAGVAQAGHMNDGLPTVMVRGICDCGDGSKPAADGAGWQQRAVANAAAFAASLAIAFADDPGVSSRSGGTGPRPNDPRGGDFNTTIGDNARFGVLGQNITVNGGLHMGGSRPKDSNTDFSVPGADAGTARPGRIRVLLMHGSRVFRRVIELATSVTAIITAVRSTT